VFHFCQIGRLAGSPAIGQIKTPPIDLAGVKWEQNAFTLPAWIKKNQSSVIHLTFDATALLIFSSLADEK
jgi:hypothetical protein